eukprot:jgi/Chrzof1/10210/Cz04g32240.t1
MSAVGVSIKPTTLLRAFYFSLGSIAAAGAYLSTQRLIWRGAAEVARAYGTLGAARIEPPDPLFGPKTRAYMALKWNQAVDGTLGALAQELAKRGI